MSNELDFSVNFHSMPATAFGEQFLSIFLLFGVTDYTLRTATSSSVCAEWEHKNWTQNFISLLFYGFQRINIYIEPSRKSQLFHILSLLSFLLLGISSVCSSAPEILSGRCGEWRRQQRWRCRGKCRRYGAGEIAFFFIHRRMPASSLLLAHYWYVNSLQSHRPVAAHKGRDEDWVRNRNHYYAALWMHKMHVKRRSVSGRKKNSENFSRPINNNVTVSKAS